MSNMVIDNGYLLYKALRNKKMSFVREVFDGTTYYFARNRSARRFLESKRVNRLKLDVDFKQMMIS